MYDVCVVWIQWSLSICLNALLSRDRVKDILSGLLKLGPSFESVLKSWKNFRTRKDASLRKKTP